VPSTVYVAAVLPSHPAPFSTAPPCLPPTSFPLLLGVRPGFLGGPSVLQLWLVVFQTFRRVLPPCRKAGHSASASAVRRCWAPQLTPTTTRPHLLAARFLRGTYRLAHDDMDPSHQHASGSATKVYPCPVCSMTLASLGSLRSHMVRRHPRSPRNYRTPSPAIVVSPLGETAGSVPGGGDQGLASLSKEPAPSLPPPPALPAAAVAVVPESTAEPLATAAGPEATSCLGPMTQADTSAVPVTRSRPPRVPRRVSSRPPRQPVPGLADAMTVEDPHLRLLFQASAEEVSRGAGRRRNHPPVASSGKRRRAAARRSTPWYRFGAVCATARASFERLGDWLRSEPAAVLRPGAKPFLFAGRRLRALREFVADCGGAGLSTADQTRLYKLLVMGSWQAREGVAGEPLRDDSGTPDNVPASSATGDKASTGETGGTGGRRLGNGGEASSAATGQVGSSGGEGDHEADQSTRRGLEHVFTSANAFRNAIRDDLDRSIIDAGWRKVVLIEGGRSYTSFFRCALSVAVTALVDAKRKQLRRAPGGVGGRRDHPIDGEAFALHEAEIDKVAGEPAFVLGVHLYSDCTLVSRSGGTSRMSIFWRPTVYQEAVLSQCTNLTRDHRGSHASWICFSDLRFPFP